jgi:hypothetical protein
VLKVNAQFKSELLRAAPDLCVQQDEFPHFDFFIRIWPRALRMAQPDHCPTIFREYWLLSLNLWLVSGCWKYLGGWAAAFERAEGVGAGRVERAAPLCAAAMDGPKFDSNVLRVRSTRVLGWRDAILEVVCYACRNEITVFRIWKMSACQSTRKHKLSFVEAENLQKKERTVQTIETEKRNRENKWKREKSFNPPKMAGKSEAKVLKQSFAYKNMKSSTRKNDCASVLSSSGACSYSLAGLDVQWLKNCINSLRKYWPSRK